MIEHRQITSNADIEGIRLFISSLPITPTITDFEENIQMQTVRQNTRLWFEGPQLVAFAYVDDYCNLCFEIAPEIRNLKLEQEIVDWGTDCMRRVINKTGEIAALDSSCSASSKDRISILERMGFTQQVVRSLHFSCDLSDPIPEICLPHGYAIRCANGESEVAQLVNLHRAAFGTEQMTIEYRLAMMHAPEYDQTMDWVATSPDGNLAAFCIGSIDGEDPSTGYLDPIGTHPDHRRISLSAAMIAHGLSELKSRSLKYARFGTSSENIPMRQLAEQTGFKLDSESVWFSREVK
jgi:ribosomal protein S18 acetylase RimI-like enzyme